MFSSNEFDTKSRQLLKKEHKTLIIELAKNYDFPSKIYESFEEFSKKYPEIPYEKFYDFFNKCLKGDLKPRTTRKFSLQEEAKLEEIILGLGGIPYGERGKYIVKKWEEASLPKRSLDTLWRGIQDRKEEKKPKKIRKDSLFLKISIEKLAEAYVRCGGSVAAARKYLIEEFDIFIKKSTLSACFNRNAAFKAFIKKITQEGNSIHANGPDNAETHMPEKRIEYSSVKKLCYSSPPSELNLARDNELIKNCSVIQPLEAINGKKRDSCVAYTRGSQCEIICLFSTESYLINLIPDTIREYLEFFAASDGAVKKELENNYIITTLSHVGDYLKEKNREVLPQEISCPLTPSNKEFSTTPKTSPQKSLPITPSSNSSWYNFFKEQSSTVYKKFTETGPRSQPFGN